MLQRCKFCTSADSTTWQQVNRYGGILGYRTREIKPEKVREGRENITRLLNELNIPITEKRLEYYYHFWMAGHLLLREYTKYAGSQE